jgi:hypothetical protein
MNTRRLTKKYKYKSRNKKTRRNRKSRRSGKTRRRVLKGGLPSVSRASSRSSRSSVVPRGFIVNRTSGSSRFRPSSSSVRPGSVRPGISKVSCCDKVNIANRKRVINSINNNFHFNDVYNRLMLIEQGDLPNAIESMKLAYITRTTLQPSGAYLNMNGLKFVNYLHGKYKYTTIDEEKEKIKSIISLFDQYGMSHGIRISDLPIVQGQVSEKYFACYKDLYEEIYKKLFPRGNNDYYPVSLSAIPLYCKPRLQTVHEDGDEE